MGNGVRTRSAGRLVSSTCRPAAVLGAVPWGCAVQTYVCVFLLASRLVGCVAIMAAEEKEVREYLAQKQLPRLFEVRCVWGASASVARSLTGWRRG